MKSVIIVWTLVVISAVSIVAQPSDGRQKQFNLERSGLAIQGYDPVAYFTAGKALEGKKELVATYNGVTYRFVSEGNKNLFKATPEKYQPQYGGWCAYAMGAKGEKVDVDPETFKLMDGKLYLFYNKFFNNTLESWNEDEVRLKSNADNNWLKFIR